ncbi:MAG: hypothetical protein AAB553_02675 [Patescibacteria group bacterium]
MDNQQQLASPPSRLETFVNALIDKRFAGQEIDNTVKNKMKEDLLDRLDEFILASTLNKLTDDEIDQFEKLVNEEKQIEEIRQFTVTRIPNYNDFIATALLSFEKDYLGQQ